MFAMSPSCFQPSDGTAVSEHEMPQWERGKTNQSVLTNLRLLFLVSIGYNSITAAWLSKLECSPGLHEPGQLFCHTLGGDGCTSQGGAVIRGGGRGRRRANVWEAPSLCRMQDIRCLI